MIMIVYKIVILARAPHEIVIFNNWDGISGFWLDWRQCGNSLALGYLAVVMELPDSLWMNCKSEFGIIFFKYSQS